jgi:hypothetical protein
VLAHEANIDALWNTTIKAMLQACFPDATPDQLSDARGYAYTLIRDVQDVKSTRSPWARSATTRRITKAIRSPSTWPWR